MILKENLSDIGVYILEGMTERDACVLAGVSFADFQEAKETQPIVREFVEKKNIEFKYNHVKEIQKNKSDKTSQWLLEKLRPEEFGSKARGDQGPTINIIGAIIKDIQNDNKGIVRNDRGSREIEVNHPGRLRVAEALD